MAPTKHIALLLISSYFLHLAGADTNGFAAESRSEIDLDSEWTMVQRQGFPSDGSLTGFSVYLERSLDSYPITIGLFRPSDLDSCTFTVIKTWPLSGNSPGVLTVTLTGDDVMPYKAGDSLGLTWYNTGNIPYDNVDDQNYCEDSVVVGDVGSTMSLVADRYGAREYSLIASFLGQQFSKRDTVDLHSCTLCVRVCVSRRSRNSQSNHLAILRPRAPEVTAKAA